MTELWYWGLHVAALGIVVAVLVILHSLIKRGDGLGIWGLVVGKDRRVSTSKLQVTIWTVFIPAAMISIILHATYCTQVSHTSSLVSGYCQASDDDEEDDKEPPLTPLENAAENLGLTPAYFFLLGIPAAGALGAKAITASKVSAGTKSKVEAKTDPGFARGVAESIGDDEGNVEIFDLQYFLFNIVALVFFLVQFLLATDGLEFPTIPNELLYLTGASAVGYLTRKTLEKDMPTLTGVYPEAAAPGEKVWLRGVNLTLKVAAGAGNGNDSEVKVKGVSFGGRRVSAEEPLDVVNDKLEVTVPKGIKPGSAPIRVVRTDGAMTDKLDFSVLDASPQVRSIYPTRVKPKNGDFDGQEVITVLGSRFGRNTANGRNGEAPPGASVMLDGRELKVRSWYPERVRVYAPTAKAVRDGDFDRMDDLDLVVFDKDGNTSDPQPVTLLKPPESPNQRTEPRNGQKRQEEVEQ